MLQVQHLSEAVYESFRVFVISYRIPNLKNLRKIIVS